MTQTQTVDYGESVKRLEAVVAAELQRGILPGVSIALIDDQRVVLVQGYGLANKARSTKADADTIYRAGSISKLFTAVAAMQLAEQGRLSIDAPVTQFVPEFHIVNPFADAKPIALRHLMSHRSGMIRESPVGGYFDDAQPSVAATIASLAQCALVLPPEAKTKYSNVGPTIVGQAVSHASGLAFEDYARERLLEPLGMTHASFRKTDALRPDFAQGYMEIADGRGGWRSAEAPWFELGTMPAGNLYCSARDLSKFAMMLLAGGQSGERRIIREETLRGMFTPQFTSDAQGFGLGFFVGQFRGHRVMGHTGAVYGFSTSITILPESKIGVVVLSNADLAIGPVQKISHAALSAMLEAKVGEHPEAPPPPVAVPLAELTQLAGDYESPSYWGHVAVSERGDVALNVSGQTLSLTPTSRDQFIGDGRCAQNSPVAFERSAEGNCVAFTALTQRFVRVNAAEQPDPPAEWQKFLGGYGPDFIPLIVTQRHGHLYAMTENDFDYRLTPLNRVVFKTPAGLYEDEQIVFEVGADGEVHSVLLANMRLKRSPH